MVVDKGGKLIADWDIGKPRGPIEAMSANKSVVSLAIGRLLGAGKIKSLDQPAADFFPKMNGKLSEAHQFWTGLYSVFHDENTRGRLTDVNEQLKKNSPAGKVVGQGPAIAFSAQAYLGQYLVAVPRHRIVAVRQRRSPANHDPNDSRNGFSDFEQMVVALAN